jgi:GT2 family glycosyltransferase
MVDAVIVTSNSRALVLRCLEHLRDPVIEQVIVVDNASEDGTEEAVREAFPDVRVVRIEPHGGLSSAFNRGAELADAEAILFLNDDIFAAEGAVAALAETLRARGDAASAGGRLVDPGEHGATQDRYRPHPFPTLATFVVGLTGLERLWPVNPWTGAHLRHRLNDEDTVPVDQPAGACLLVRRSAFEAIGGWDEGFWFWYEDVDISRRLVQHGAALYVPTAVFEHVGGGTVLRWSRAEILARTHHGILRYGQKHFTPARRTGLALLLIGLSLPAIAVFAFSDRETARVRWRIVKAALRLLRGKSVPRLRG